jgi:hypothetical protein
MEHALLNDACESVWGLVRLTGGREEHVLGYRAKLGKPEEARNAFCGPGTSLSGTPLVKEKVSGLGLQRPHWVSPTQQGS